MSYRITSFNVSKSVLSKGFPECIREYGIAINGKERLKEDYAGLAKNQIISCGCTETEHDEAESLCSTGLG